MSHPTIATIGASLLISIAGLTGPPAVEAQAASGGRSSAGVALQLQSLDRERALLWASSAPVIRCVPAPLTERPTAAAEFARPTVLPLESAFRDAAVVKRTLASRPR